jgi:hypothetical protein
MSNPLKIFRLNSKKQGVRTSVTESVTVTVHHHTATPEVELAKWEEVLDLLGKKKQISQQERLAREVIRKRIKELKEAI